MAYNGVLTSPPPPPPPPGTNIFYCPSSPPVLKHFTPPSDWKWLLLHFSLMATSNKHMFTFLKLLQLIKCRHSWFLKMLKQYIKDTRFHHHTFLFFMCDDLSFINTIQKTLKPSKKTFKTFQYLSSISS